LQEDSILDGKDGTRNTVHETVQCKSLNNNNSEDVDGTDGIQQNSKAEDLRSVRL
jgi:hypothetical protein